ncbi:MAG: DegT/DnrJ/EryC1/StrS family aminotransferase [Proteobacteria bacterium]|nr:DegT/DnrJ/EryC1/StrS family aminotransferase [Pseudomonadota bacterium]
MTAPVIPWFQLETGPEEIAAVDKVIASNYLNDGNVTRAFEVRVAEILGVKHCVASTSGTTALTLALMACGVGPGDEVIVPDLTFIASANAARLAGASVKLVDVEPRRFTIDLQRLAAAIGPKTRAVMPVDVNGRGADYQALEPFCAKHGLKLVCDAAEAFGSRWGGRMLGTWGDAACFSFSPNKTVSTGQGGCVTTNDTAIYHRLLELKDHGRRRQGTGGNDLHPVMGYNFKLTNMQAAIGLAQLDRLGTRLAGFRQRNRWYAELLADCPGVILPPIDDNGGEITQWTDALTDRAEVVEAALTAAGIGSRRFWYPIHRQEPYAAPDAEFPHAIGVSARGIWLPSHFQLTREEVERTAKVVRSAFMGDRRA